MRQALRALTRSPAYGATVVLVVAVCVCAAGVVFSVVDAALWRVLYAQDRGHVVVVWASDAEHRLPLVELSYPDSVDLISHTSTLENAAAFGSSYWTGVLLGAGDPVSINFAGVSASFFDVLRTRPQLGRTFAPVDEQPGAADVVVISDSLWRSRFHGTPGIVGTPVTLDHRVMTIVGVMDRDLAFPAGVEAWVPLWPYLRATLPPSALQNLRRTGFLYLVARLQGNATIDRCRAELTSEIRTANTRDYGHAFGESVVLPYTSFVLGAVKPALVLVSVAVLLLLLIACVNLAGLVMVRAARGDRELAIRRALGASHLRAIVPLLSEIALLCAAGTICGLLCGRVLLPAVVGHAPAELVDLRQASFDVPAVLVGIAAAIILMSTCAAAVLRSVRAIGIDLRGIRPMWPRRRGAALVGAELALTLGLTVTSLLAASSSLNLARTDLGYNPGSVLLLDAPSGASVPAARQHEFARALESRLHGMPDVVAAGAVSLTPFELGPIGDDRWARPLDGAGLDPSAEPHVGFLVATPGYFPAMGMRLARGRLFTDFDTARSLPVAIVTETTARQLWGAADPVGKRVTVGGDDGGTRTIVGVIADTRTRRLSEPSTDFYVPATQSAAVPGTWAIRISSGPTVAGPAIRTAARELDASRAIRLQRFDARLRSAEQPWHAAALTMTVLAGMTLVLALIGVHGLLAYTVSVHAREFGIRIALGAGGRQIAHDVVAPLVAPCAAATVVGLSLALAGARLMASWLFGVGAIDAWSYTGGVALILMTVAAACAPPVRHAITADPAATLRLP